MNQAPEQMLENKQTTGYHIPGLLRSAFLLFLGLLLTAVIIVVDEGGLALFKVAHPGGDIQGTPGCTPAVCSNIGIIRGFSQKQRHNE